MGCGAWHTITNEPAPERAVSSDDDRQPSTSTAKAMRSTDIEDVEIERVSTGFPAFDHVLGGGAPVKGVIMVSGGPGLGKTTLLAQVLCHMARSGMPVLYATAEQTEGEIAALLERTGARHEDLFVARTLTLRELEQIVREIEPECLVIDSIQAIRDDSLTSEPGSVKQCLAVINRLMELTKNPPFPPDNEGAEHPGFPCFIVCQVNKSLEVAGPKKLEHAVDAVVTFEPRGDDIRIARVRTKNRFGATGVHGSFEMTERGLVDLTPKVVKKKTKAGGKVGGKVLALRKQEA
jgi:DNA repair protein RadA/Sms